jgi:hypothetical protein
VDRLVDGDRQAEMANRALGGRLARTHTGRHPGTVVRPAGKGDLRWQRRFDAVEAFQVANQVLRDRRSEALHLNVDRFVTQPKG